MIKTIVKRGPDDRTLYRIDYRVRPTEDHPRYGQSAGGILCIWLFERSSGEAGVRSMHLLDVLPFQTVGHEVQYQDEFSPPNVAMQILLEQVELCGFSFYYHAHPDATDIARIPFPGEKAA